MSTQTDERLEVRLHDRDESRLVGELRDVGTGPHFAYDPTFLRDGVDLSPFGLPRRSGLFAPGPRGLYRLQGLFFDSLPDGWGLKLLHQTMRQAGIEVERTSSLTWLRALGTRGMGALTFHPTLDAIATTGHEAMDLETLAAEARRVDAEHVDDVMPALALAGGSPGGARPKIVAGWHDSGAIVDAFAPLPAGYRPTLIKFASQADPDEAPLVEAAYLSMAQVAGIDVTPHRVHALPDGQWALVVDRFDRVGEARRHVHTLAGLLDVDIKEDAADYGQLLATALRLTNDFRVTLSAWKRAAFNVGAFNRDDHARNVAFLMEPDGQWRLAPAYDLTYAEGAGGYHAMLIAGESRNPVRADLLRLADKAGLDRVDADRGIDEVRAALNEWPHLARSFNVPNQRIKAIEKTLAVQSTLLAHATTAKRRR